MRIAALSLLAISLSTVCLAAGHEVTTPVQVPVPAYSQGALATNGSTFLVVFAKGPTIYGSFAAADGTPINSALPLVKPARLGTYQVATIDGHYVLYWTDDAVPYLGDLTLDGQVRNTRRVDAPPLITPMIATQDSALFVVGQNSEPGPAHDDAQILRADGSSIAKPIPVSNTWGLREAVAVGDTFVVTTTEANSIFIQRFSRDGTLLPPGKVKLSSQNVAAGHAVAATDGNQVVVVWGEHTDATTQDMFNSALLTRDLQLVQRHATTIGDGRFISDSNLAWNGNQYIAVATLGDVAGVSRTVAMHLDRSGIPLDTSPAIDGVIGRVVANAQTAYGVGLNGDHVLTTWSLDAATLALKHSSLLSYGLPDQRYPTVASDGVDFAIIFEETSATTHTLKMALFDRNGTPKSGEGIVVTIGIPRASIAYGDSTYLVAWLAPDGKIYARRFTREGASIDTQPFVIASANSSAIITWTGDSFFVFWSRSGKIYGSFVGSDGSVSGEHYLAPDGIGPSIAWNGSIFLLVVGTPVTSLIEAPPSYGDILAHRISADGSPIDTTAIEVMHQDQTINGAMVASNGRDFMVAVDRSNGITVLPISATSNAITIGAPSYVFSWFGNPTAVIRFDGQQYVLGWRYSRAIVGTWWVASGRLENDRTLRMDGADAFLSAVDSSMDAASNQLGDRVTVVSEADPDSYVPRVRAHLNRELSPLPALPHAPTNVTAIASSIGVELHWDVASDAEGVIIDAESGPDVYPLGVFTALQRVTTIVYPPFPIRVRAFNAAGLSDPVVISVPTPARRRVVR